jgi:hypothetical protein
MLMTYRKGSVTLFMSPVLKDRLTTISARLNLPLSEVVMRLLLIGLETSSDLALSEPSVEGIAKYARHPVV